MLATTLLAITVSLLGNLQTAYAYSVEQNFQWASTFGGSGLDVAFGVSSDLQGNVYSTGGFSGTNINFNPDGTDIKNSNGGRDVFVTKRNTDGSYGWTKTFGGTGFESPGMMAGDTQGNTYSVGSFTGTATNFNSDGSDIKNSSVADKYITKFLSDGTYGWTKTIKASIQGIDLDSSGSVYVTGTFSGTNINFNPDGSDLRSSSGGSGFLTKFLSDGTYGWTKTFRQLPARLAVSSDGKIAIAGSFTGANVNFNPDGSDVFSSAGSTDAFYTILANDGTYIQSRKFGGATGDSIKIIRFDTANNIYTFGSFTGTNTNFNPDGSDLHSSRGGSDLFVQKIMANGTYGWTKTIGSTASTEANYGLGVDTAGVVYAIGTFSTADTNFNSDGSALFTPTGVDSYINLYGSDGSYKTTKIIGGTSSQNAYAGGIDINDNLLVAGDYTGTNINFNPDGSDLHSSNGQDAYMLKFLANRIQDPLANGNTANNSNSALASTGQTYTLIMYTALALITVTLCTLFILKRHNYRQN